MIATRQEEMIAVCILVVQKTLRLWGTDGLTMNARFFDQLRHWRGSFAADDCCRYVPMRLFAPFLARLCSLPQKPSFATIIRDIPNPVTNTSMPCNWMFVLQ
jgi:hypothetical protein